MACLVGSAGGSAVSKAAAPPGGGLPRTSAVPSTSRVTPKRAGTTDAPIIHNPTPGKTLPAGGVAAGTAHGRSPNTLPAGSSQNSSRVPTAPSTRPTSTSSTSGSGSLDTRSSDTPTKAAAAKPQWLQQLKQQSVSGSTELHMCATSEPAADGSAAATPSARQHGVFGAEGGDSSVTGTAQGSCMPHAAGSAAGSFEAAVNEWRQDALACSPSCAGSSSVDRTSQQGSSLLDGAYNEAEAANSFQEALQQWRQAGSSSGSGGAGAACVSGAASSGVVGRSPVKAVAGERHSGHCLHSRRTQLAAPALAWLSRTYAQPTARQ